MSNLIKETIKKKRKKRTSLRLFVMKIVGNDGGWNVKKTRIEFNYYTLSLCVLIIPAQSIRERGYTPIQVLQSGEASSKRKRSA